MTSLTPAPATNDPEDVDVAATTSSMAAIHADEPHDKSHAGKLNWLRAGVLGANDGIVSVAGIVIGVAGATRDWRALLTAGVAGLSAGALSMAVGEFVSVSTQRDTERALIAKERRELEEEPELELEELTALYEMKGIPRELAEQVAIKLTEGDALAAHAEVELGIDPYQHTNPVEAAIASAISFTLGGIVPVLGILLLTGTLQIPGTVAAVVLALVITGVVSARLGGSSWVKPVARNVIGGLVAMGVTYWIGRLVGLSI